LYKGYLWFRSELSHYDHASGRQHEPWYQIMGLFHRHMQTQQQLRMQRLCSAGVGLFLVQYGQVDPMCSLENPIYHATTRTKSTPFSEKEMHQSIIFLSRCRTRHTYALPQCGSFIGHHTRRLDRCMYVVQESYLSKSTYYFL
jgi:hypothetical protein